MKKILVLLTTLIFFLFAIPNHSQAQCPSGPENNPCFALPSGPCVCYPNGKFRAWITTRIIVDAKPSMDQEFNYSFGQYLQAYYRTEEMSIQYLGGDWTNGQSFRVTIGGCVISVITDGL